MPRPVRRKLKKPALALLVLVVLIGYQLYQRRNDPDPAYLAEGSYTVRRVIDGDTLLLDNDSRVRLQGIDTPETVKPDHPVEKWGKEASQFTRDRIAANGMSVRLQFGRERVDKFGRALAFVWLGDQLLNEELVRAGLAEVRTDYRYSQNMKDRLLAAQEEARTAQVGVWSP